MIGDKRFDDGIFAFSESNNFGSFDEGMGDFWLDRIDGLMYGVVNGKTKMKEEIQTKGEDPWENPFGAEGYRRLKTSWRQLAPYNNYCPAMPTSKAGDGTFNGRAPAGCVAVAMGQIMAYHSWPTSGNYERYYRYPGQTGMLYFSYNWSQMTAAFSARNLSSTGRDMVANFLANIGYKVGMNYGEKISTASRGNAFETFQNMGYNAQYISNKITPAIVKDNISRNLPMYVEADNGSSGHAFIINGYSYPNQHLYYVTAAAQYTNQDGWYTYKDVLGYEYKESPFFIYNITPKR